MKDAVAQFVQTMRYTEPHKEYALVELGNILSEIGLDQTSERRGEIMYSILKNFNLEIPQINRELRHLGETATLSLSPSAPYYWEKLRKYVYKRSIAVVILEEWQRRICSEGMCGRKRDRDAFEAECHIEDV